MTREVINKLKNYTLGKMNTDKVEISVLKLNRIIKALEQEPCEDCISRKNLIGAYLCEGIDCRRCQFNLDENGCLLVNRIENLPSIHPKPKTDVLDKIKAEIDRQQKWLLQAGYTAYNVDIAFDAMKAVVAESEE